MKNLKKVEYLPLTVLAFGILGLALRRLLYAFAVDEKNLLVSGHPLETALWAVVLAGVAVIVLFVRKLDGSNAYEDNFGPSAVAALGHFLMGYSILMLVLLDEPGMPGRIGTVWQVMGFVTAPALVWAGFCRLKGKKPFFLIHGLTSVFLLLHVVTHYQHWSGNPQLQDYVFDLFAAVMLMLFSYYAAAFEAGMGKRRMQLATGLLALLLCGVSLSGTEFPGLYVSGSVWAAADLCRLMPKPKPRESEGTDEAS